MVRDLNGLKIASYKKLLDYTTILRHIYAEPIEVKLACHSSQRTSLSGRTQEMGVSSAAFTVLLAKFSGKTLCEYHNCHQSKGNMRRDVDNRSLVHRNCYILNIYIGCSTWGWCTELYCKDLLRRKTTYTSNLPQGFGSSRWNALECSILGQLGVLWELKFPISVM